MPQVPAAACLAQHVQHRPTSLTHTVLSLPCLAAPELTGQGGAYIGPQYQTNLWHTAKRRPLNPR